MTTYVDNYERVLQEKARGTGEVVRFKCPFPGCVSYDKRAFCVNVATGTWCCHHCNQERPDQNYNENSTGAHGGSALEFAQMMGDDPCLWPVGRIEYTPKAKATALTGKRRRELFTSLFEACELTPEHKAEIEARGIDPTQAGIVSAPADLLDRLQKTFDAHTLLRGGLVYEDRAGTLLPRHCIGKDRILIPYYDQSQVYYFVGYAHCPRRRPDQTPEEYQYLRESWAKVAGPAGYTPAIYGEIPESAQYVIITEGQFKAIAAIQNEFVCIGMQGIMTGHASVVKKCVATKVKRVIILFDTQKDDQDNVDWAADKLARELLTAGLATYRCCLPLDANIDKGRKMDIDAYLNTAGKDSFIEQLSHCSRYAFQSNEDEEDNGREEDDQ